MKTKDLIAYLNQVDPTGEAECVLWDHKPMSPKLWSVGMLTKTKLMINKHEIRQTIGPHTTLETYQQRHPKGKRTPVDGLIIT